MTASHTASMLVEVRPDIALEVLGSSPPTVVSGSAVDGSLAVLGLAPANVRVSPHPAAGGRLVVDVAWAPARPSRTVPRFAGRLVCTPSGGSTHLRLEGVYRLCEVPGCAPEGTNRARDAAARRVLSRYLLDVADRLRAEALAPTV